MHILPSPRAGTLLEHPPATPRREVPMRRTLSLVVLVLAAAAGTACSDVTAPSQDECGPVGGSHTCQAK